MDLHFRTDHDSGKQFLKRMWGGVVMERKPLVSFKNKSIKNIPYRNIYSYLNRHIF